MDCCTAQSLRQENGGGVSRFKRRNKHGINNDKKAETDIRLTSSNGFFMSENPGPPNLDADEVRQQVRRVIERLRKELPRALEDEPAPADPEREIGKKEAAGGA
jgi:hypothetical protein